jgi:hypothetical protein
VDCIRLTKKRSIVQGKIDATDKVGDRRRVATAALQWLFDKSGISSRQMNLGNRPRIKQGSTNRWAGDLDRVENA